MNKGTVTKAEAIERKFGSNYYLATLFLPPKIKEAVFVLYAFVRIPDEIVDNPKPGSDPEAELRAWQEDWQRCYFENENKNDIMVASREVFKTYAIPYTLSEEFIAAMVKDLTTNRYQTYPDLQVYMRGSAEVVGLMLVHIFGSTDTRALKPAMQLGEAMQLTNFLRDVGEDWRERRRIYLPLEDLGRHGVAEAVFENEVITSEFAALIKDYIKKARQLFTDANAGIPLLPKETRRAVSLASRFYEGILDRIEENQYDVLTKKAKHSLLQKIRIIINDYVS